MKTIINDVRLFFIRRKVGALNDKLYRKMCENVPVEKLISLENKLVVARGKLFALES
ncbi:MAG: hypothetical protein R3Y27_05590 [Clostridia bacterium]